MPISIPVTLLYGGLSALLVVGLGINVSLRRLSRGVLAGAPLPPDFTIPVRAHGNAAEWVPLGLVLLLAVELSGGGTRFTLHLAGGCFFLGRVLHAIGFLTRTRLTIPAAALNYTVVAVLAVWALVLRAGR